MSAGGQMALPLVWRPALGREDFLVTDCNRDALAAIDAGHAWPGGRLALSGPRRAGKTHLAQVWRADTGAAETAAQSLAGADIDALASGSLLVEDADRIAGRDEAERGLLHLMNLMQARHHPLLLTGCAAPAGWRVVLPDLASRLAAMQVATIAPPDDALLSSVIVKLASDRRLALPPPVVHYLVQRMERSLMAAERTVAALDRASLAQRRRITLGLAAEILRAGAGE